MTRMLNPYAAVWPDVNFRMVNLIIKKPFSNDAYRAQSAKQQVASLLLHLCTV